MEVKLTVATAGNHGTIELSIVGATEQRASSILRGNVEICGTWCWLLVCDGVPRTTKTDVHVNARTKDMFLPK